MRLHPERLWIGALLALVVAVPVAHGQDGDGASAPPPVELVADRAEVDEAEGISVYRGDVVLTRGALRITGDVMRVFSNGAGELEQVTVNGTPATYRETVADAAPRRAEAPRMEYFVADPERLILKQGGRLWQGDNTVTGRTVTHYPETARTVAESGADDDERVNVSVNPATD
ncbi:lipopolysaccharide transport periplasmic protein LptA [Spiribacter roseus]|uniref:lipopolysaccharide transport periplasmic protein LptA n=1 Tax=Spiribacter roseus TaxID=1855875 RepID=UPI00132F9C91|nr:lipopolysaccharide transport periplasmic protein LptA [Spiribacter roseus]KAF0282550.1 lipopolysaccharide transport periplasmic protein LptA [Spiribacter roseus]